MQIRFHIEWAVAALLFALTPSTWAQAGDRRAAIEFDTLEDETGHACRDQERKFSRLFNSRLRSLVTGPAADRRDISYGSKPRERLDIFSPPQRDGLAPMIVMVHGGGWCVGDKAMKAVTRNKVAHYVSKGFLFVSLNYPMLTDGANALAQAESVARALAYVQRSARNWGADERKLVLMGHSAGAHLVSLVNADARLRSRAGAGPVLGVVSLDSGATDVVTQLRGLTNARAKERYQEAFGRDEAAWVDASPLHQIDQSAAPWLGVCSTRRKDDPCGQARSFAKKANQLGVKAQTLELDKSHGDINGDLGAPGSYTAAVDEFLSTLDPLLSSALRR